MFKTNRWLNSLLVTVTMTTFTLAGCAANTPAATPTPRADYKLGIILNAGGTIHDGTFNETAYKGATLAARDFGLDIAYRETVEDKDYPGAIDKMLKDNRNIIVTVGFQMQQDTLDAATKNPKVFFIGVDEGADTPPANFVGLQYKDDEGGFLAGALAGMMTKSNVVGVVGGMKIPPVERFVNGFVNGVKYVNSSATALSVFTSSFTSPDEGRQNADDMIGKNADVIFGAGGLTGSTGIAYAASKKVFVIGVDQDEYQTTFLTRQNAEYILTSALKRVDLGVYNAIKAILDNKFASMQGKKLGATECGITYADFHDAAKSVPDSVKTKLEAIWRLLASGKLATGAGEDKRPAPDSLAAGTSLQIPSDAPQLSSCNRS